MRDDPALARAFLKQSPGCHWIVGPGGVFESIYGDPAGILGRPAAELIGRPMTEVLDPDLATTWEGRLARAFAGETQAVRERRSDAVWNLSIFPIRLEEEIRFTGCFAREATAWSNAEQQLRFTVLQSLKAQDQERSRMSRFLHDSIGQNLTALGLRLDLVRMDLATLAPESCTRIEDIQKALEPMMAEVREYSYTLNPSNVERAGLRSALDRLAARVRPDFPGVLRVQVDASVRLEPKVASAIYRIAEEALENALKHSSCSVIEIAVKSTRTATFLEVRDNGAGFDPGDLSGGFRGLGLLSMEHYAAESGLSLSIESRRGAGTAVRAEIRGIPKG